MSYVPSVDRYQGMVYNRCGRSGLKLSAISLGLYQHFTDNDVFANAQAIVRKAFDLGITHFDLANNYGGGSSEAIMGRILAQDFQAYRDEMIVTTKAGYDMWPGPYGEWGSRKYLIASLDQSLKRLGLDYVDIFYSHRPDPETPLEETMGALDSIVRSGKALYVGISNYDADMAAKAFQILKDLGTPCLIHQPSYSMFNRWIEDGLQDVLAENGVGSVVFQPLQRGVLTDAFLGGIPADQAASLAEWGITEERVAKARKLNEIAKARGQKLSQMALAWALRGGKVTSVLVGAKIPAHVEDNVQALKNLSFTQEELDQIDAILKS